MDLGLDEAALRALGVRLLRVGLIYPLDAEAIREFARDLREIVVVEEKRGFLEGQVKEALAGASARASGCSARPTRRARRCSRSRAAWTPTWWRSGWAPACSGWPRVGPIWRRASGAASTRSRRLRARPHETHRGPHAELLLGMPSQRGHAAPARRGGMGQPRVPLVRLDHRAARAAHRVDDAAGRRGAAVDRARAVHRPAAHGAERRGRLAVPLVVPQHPVLRGGRRQHDLQDPLQRVRREHRRPGDGRRKAGARADADARAGRRAGDGGPDQGPRRLSRRGSRRERARGGRRAAGRGAAGARGDTGRHRADPRRPVRQRAPAPPEAASSCRRRTASS